MGDTMVQLRDLTVCISQLNSIGRLVCLLGVAVHAYVALYAGAPFLLLLVGCYAVATYGFYHFLYKVNFLNVPRFERAEVECPSNSRRPDWDDSITTTNGQLLSGRRTSLKHMHPSESDDSALQTTAEMEHKQRSDPRLTLTIDGDDVKTRLQDRNGNLNMNHLKMSFAQFFTGYLMTVPSAFLLQIIGLGDMAVRRWLLRHGLVKPGPVDFAVEVAHICLNWSATAFAGFKDEEETVAIFAWSDFPYVLGGASDAPTELDYADLLVIDIDVSSPAKRFVKAMLDDRELTAAEVYILLNFHGVIAYHPRTHALACWGVNASVGDPFIRWNSVVTIMYNYFGCQSFAQVMSGYAALGFLKDKKYGIFPELFGAGIEMGIPPHPHIRKLVKHSEYVRFITGARNIFLNEFQDHKKEFMGIDGEALFVGTVIHSLEHMDYATHIRDLLWLDHSHSEFGFMADAAQFILSGYVKDLPLLPFNRRFKNATHPFYKAVYEGARQLSPWYADRMDTCIIK